MAYTRAVFGVDRCPSCGAPFDIHPWNEPSKRQCAWTGRMLAGTPEEPRVLPGAHDLPPRSKALFSHLHDADTGVCVICDIGRACDPPVKDPYAVGIRAARAIFESLYGNTDQLAQTYLDQLDRLAAGSAAPGDGEDHHDDENQDDQPK